MATKVEKEDELLRQNGFDPENLDETARAEALQMIVDSVPPAETPPAAPPAKERYFRTDIAGLSVNVGAPKPGEIAHQTVRFEPILRQAWDGHMARVGYLKTSNPVAIKILLADHNVVEVDADEYSAVMEAADDEKNKKVNRSSY